MSGSALGVGARRSAAAYAPALLWAAILLLGLFTQRFLTDAWRGEMIVTTLLVTVVQLVAAANFFRFLSGADRLRFTVWIATSIVIFAIPFLIPADARPLRFVTACASVILVMKLWDLHVGARRGQQMTWDDFLPHLVNPFAVLLRTQPSRPVSREQSGRDVRRHGLAASAGAAAIAALFLIPWRSVPLIVEHVVKATVIFLTAVAFLELIVAIVRVAGGTLPDFSRAPLLARTPADFWRRYNRILQQFFFENIFRSVGGRRTPRVAALLIFALSGLVHEYVFGIAIGRVTGFQMTFFLLQGIAVAATLRVKPRRPMAITASTAATIAFNLATSFFFFLSFHAVVRLYANSLPRWIW